MPEPTTHAPTGPPPIGAVGAHDETGTLGTPPPETEPGQPSADHTPESTPEQPARRSLLQTIAALLGSQIATWAIGFALTILVPRYLGPDGVGSLGVATALWSVAGVAIAFGTGTLLTLELARDAATGATFVRPTVRSRVALFLPALPLVVAFAILSGQDQTTVVVTIVFAATILFRGLADVGRAGLFGLHQASATAVPDILTKVALVLIVPPVLVLGGGVVSIAAIHVVPAILGAWLLWRPFSRRIRDYTGTPQTVRKTLRRGLPFLAGDASAMAYHNVDVIVLSMLVSSAEVGWYSVLDTLVASFYFIPTILISAVFPRLAEVHALDPKAYETLFMRALRVLVLAGVPIGFGMIVVAEQIVVLLFGDEFREAGAALQVYGVVVVLGFVNVLLGLHAVIINRQNTRTVLLAAGALATIVLDLILVPWTHQRYGNGAVGGVLSYVFTEMGILVVFLVMLARFALTRATGVYVLKCVVAGGLMTAACWPLRDAFLALPVAVGALVYGAALIALRTLTQDERAIIDSGLTKITSRVRIGGHR